MSGLDIPLEGKGIRQLCGIVLCMEAIVIGLAILPAIVLEHANPALAAGVGGALAICALLIGGVVGRPRMGWAVLAGSVLQFLVIAAGVVVPAPPSRAPPAVTPWLERSAGSAGTPRKPWFRRARPAPEGWRTGEISRAARRSRGGCHARSWVS